MSEHEISTTLSITTAKKLFRRIVIETPDSGDRDTFIHDGKEVSLNRLFIKLANCRDPLPSDLIEALNLMTGTTYGDAAQAMIQSLEYS